jgi:threonine dehydratase
MEKLELGQIEKAAERLKGVIHETPLEHSETFSNLAGGDVYLKYENQQKTGSFKIRGAYNKICELKEKGETKKVIAASAGNHAQGVAFAAAKLNMDATIVMSKCTPIAKVKATEGYGAKVCLYGDCYDDAYDKAMELQKEEGGEFIHPFNDVAVIEGQGTLGLEILKAIPSVDYVLVPVGGGGLISGVAYCIKQINPRVKIIGVQAEGASAIYQSFKTKKRVELSSVTTMAEGIAVKKPGDKTLEYIYEYVDDMVTVSDAEISSAILILLERNKQMVEPAGAASLAAVMSKKVDITGKKAVCILSGGNIDVSFIHRIIDLGLLSRNRKLKFKTIMPDIPGSLEKFAKIIADANANVVMLQYDRMSAELDPNEVIIHVGCEVGDKEHGEKVISMLEKSGYRVIKE